MKNVAALLALTGGASATGWLRAGSYALPDNTITQCSPEQAAGFDFASAPLDKNSWAYGGMNWNGFTCKSAGAHKRFDRRHGSSGSSSNHVTGICSAEKSKCPSFASADKTGKFSVASLSVRPEFDCDLEFHYGMADGSVCRQRSACSSKGSSVPNTQCGGAQNVTVVYPSQAAKPKASCSVTIPSVAFACVSTTTPLAKATKPAVVPVYSTTSPTTDTMLVATSTGIPGTSVTVSFSSASLSLSRSVPVVTTPVQPVTTPARTTTENSPVTAPSHPVPANSVPANSVPANSVPANSVPANSESYSSESVSFTSVPFSVPFSVPSASYPAVALSTSVSTSVPVRIPSSSSFVTVPVMVPSSAATKKNCSTLAPSGSVYIPIQVPSSATTENSPVRTTPVSAPSVPVTVPSGSMSVPVPVPSVPVTVPSGSMSVPVSAPSVPVLFPSSMSSATTENSPVGTGPVPSGPVVTPLAPSPVWVPGTTLLVTRLLTTTYIAQSISTVYSTDFHTITHCGASITNCPAELRTHVATSTVIVAVSTTICPVTATQVLTPGATFTPGPTVPVPHGVANTPVASSPVVNAPVASSPAANAPVVPSPAVMAPPPAVVSPLANSPAVEASPPPATVAVPKVVPSCLNTWLATLDCKDNTDVGCYCPSEAFVSNVFACMYAHCESDVEVAHAISYFQGICAPYAHKNPGVATGADAIKPYLNIPAGSMPAPVGPMATIPVNVPAVVPMTDAAGHTMAHSSMTITVRTTITVPQVALTDGPAPSGGRTYGVVPVATPVLPIAPALATSANSPVATDAQHPGPGAVAAAAAATPTSSAPGGSVGTTTAVSPASTSDFVSVNGAGRTGAGLGLALAVVAVVAAAL